MSYTYLEIAGSQIPSDDILLYDYGMDRNFGAARFSVTLKNDDDAYNSLDFNDVVIFKEGLYGFDGSLEIIPKFYGLIRQTDFQRSNGGAKSIIITALDLVCRLQDLEYEGKHEAIKIYVTDEELTPATGQDTTNCRVFDSKHTNWANDPMPSIRIEDLIYSGESIKWDGFEINYQGGQIILSLGLNIADASGDPTNYALKATYAYYKEGTYLEDVIKDIIISQDGYGNSVFTENDNLKEWFIGARGSVGDDDIDRKTTLSVATTGGETSITVGDTTNFDSSGTAYFDNGDGTYDEFTYTGKDATHFTGCSGVEAHAQDTEIIQVRDYLIPNYAPAVIDRKVVLSAGIGTTDTTIPVKPETQSMLPNSDISEWDGNVLRYYPWYEGGYGGDANGVTFSGDGSTAVWGLFHQGNLASNLKVGDRYLLSFYAKYSGTVPTQGTLNMDFYGTGLDTSDLQVACSTLTTDYVRYTSSNFALASVPSDIVCRIFVDGTLTNGSVVHVKNWVLEKVADDSVTTACNFWVMDDFDSSGYVKVNDEYVYYADRDYNSFNNCTRAELGSTAAAHEVNAIATQAYPAGQLWYLAHNNHITSLVSGDFYLSEGSIASIDKRYGMLVLSAAISTSASVYCKKNYQFYTIQATGIEIGNIAFTYKNIVSRFDALQKIRKSVAPNYVIMTKGSKKVWGQYLKQKTNEDFELQLTKSLSHAQDTDLYTRVRVWGKNINPQNILISDTKISISQGDTFTGIATRVELKKIGESDDGKYFIFQSGLGSVRITGTPMVYINGVPATRQTRQVIRGQGVIKQGELTNIRPSGKIKKIYDTYIIFGHPWIDPGSTIRIYDSQGVEKVTLNPDGDPEGDPNVDYQAGFWAVPGSKANGTIVAEYSTVNTISFHSNYNGILPPDWHTGGPEHPVNNPDDPPYVTDSDNGFITAGFLDWQELLIVFAGWTDLPHSSPTAGPNTNRRFCISKVEDGKLTLGFLRDGSTFLYDEVPSAGHFFHVRLRGYWGGITGLATASYSVNYWKGVEIHKDTCEFWIDTNMLYRRSERDDLVEASFEFEGASIEVDQKSLMYAFDGNPDTQFQMTLVAEPVQGTELFIIDLGEEKNIDAIDITAGYFLPALVPGQWEDDPTRFGCTNYYTIKYSNNGSGYFTISKETTNFMLEAGVGIQFDTNILGENFSCRYLKFVLERSDKIVGWHDGIWCIALQNIAIYQNITLKSEAKLVATEAEVTESPPTIYDVDGLLNTVGDRVWKDTSIKEDMNTQEKIDRYAKAYLSEFYKNHTKATAEVVVDPRVMVGDTVKTIDHEGVATRYFVENISKQSRSGLQLTLARYP